MRAPLCVVCGIGLLPACLHVVPETGGLRSVAPSAKRSTPRRFNSIGILIFVQPATCQGEKALIYFKVMHTLVKFHPIVQTASFSRRRTCRDTHAFVRPPIFYTVVLIRRMSCLFCCCVSALLQCIPAVGRGREVAVTRQIATHKELFCVERKKNTGCI